MHDPEIVAEAQALMARGHSATGAANILNLEPRTVQRWAQEWRNSSQLIQRHEAIAEQATGIIQRGLNAIAAKPDEDLIKHLPVVGTLAGISTDKVQRDSAPRSEHNQLVILVTDPRSTAPQSIEAEYTVQPSLPGPASVTGPVSLPTPSTQRLDAEPPGNEA